jgi:hypothetical protein
MEGNSDSNQGRYSSDLYLKVAPIDKEDLASDDVIIASVLSFVDFTNWKVNLTWSTV